MSNTEHVTCRTSRMLLLSLESNSPDCSGVRFQNLAKPNLLSGLGWGKSNTTGAKKFDDFNSFVLFSPVDTRLKEGIFKGVTTACDAAAVAAAALPLAAASVAHLASASA